MSSKYLVRPHDFHIFEIDESNGCYRSWINKDVLNRPQAMKHFTYEILTKNYGFFEINDNELEFYKKKSDIHYDFLKWQRRSDGHDGVKGGTFEEYLNK